MDLYNPVGIFRLLLCSPNRLNNLDPLNNDGAISIGSRDDSASYEITPYGTSKTNGRSNRNKELHTIKATSKQIRIRDLDWLILWLKTGFDCQFVGEPDSGEVSGGMFNWISDTNQIGLDFVYRISDGVRNCDITLERADNYEYSKNFIDNADTGTLIPIDDDLITGMNWQNKRGEFVDRWEAPYFYEIKVPNSENLVDANNIISRTFEIKTISNKNENRVSRVRKLGIKLEMMLDNVDINYWLTLKSESLSPTCIIREFMNDGTRYEEFNFAPNILSFETSNKKGETEGFVKVMMEGEVTLSQIAFAYGAGNGGSDSNEYAGGKVSFTA